MEVRGVVVVVVGGRGSSAKGERAESEALAAAGHDRQI